MIVLKTSRKLFDEQYYYELIETKQFGSSWYEIRCYVYEPHIKAYGIQKTWGFKKKEEAEQEFRLWTEE